MSVFSLCALAVCGLFLVLLLRQYHQVSAMALSLVLSVLLLAQATVQLRLLRAQLQSLFDAAVGENAGIVLRVVGIGLLVQATADLCREADQPALEGKVILLGKLLIVASAAPLAGRALQLLSGLLL